jgi:23S rRNA (adenine2030-N6)-methyltransferase
MNYRHAFHAGNFADVFKHALLARVLAYLKRKDAPFRYVDTHAGIGLYALDAEEAKRTGEADAGVKRFLAAPRSAELDALFQPYLAALKAVNALDGRFYPGSPILAATLLREQDRLALAELHPEDFRALTKRLDWDARTKTFEMDGYKALNAWTPPPERRGVVLIDPPFEKLDEWERMTEALAKAHRKWPTGVYLLWYPIKDWRETEQFARALKELAIPRTLRLELLIDADAEPGTLHGCGMIAVNPPFTLEAEAKAMLNHMGGALRTGRRHRVITSWLVGES